MKNAKVCSAPMKSFKTIFPEDTSVSKEKAIANQPHNVQLIRNLPNILRSSNTKTSKSRNLLNKDDISLTSSTEDGNTSLELNTTLSSIDLDMEANYNKASSKLSHQRKQVHNPLNIQYDISDYNNNKNKIILPKINHHLNALYVSSIETNASTKKIKYDNKQKKRSRNKKSKKVTTRKSGNRTQMLRIKPNTLAAIPDVNMKNTIVPQNANNFVENNILTQPMYNPDFLSINVNNLHDVAIKSVEPSNIFYRNDFYNVGKKYDVNLNHVISYEPTEFNTLQQPPIAIQRDITSYEFPKTQSNLQQESINRDTDSNFLYKRQILHPCSCASCMSHDKDIIFYEDPVSTSVSSDTEADLSTCDLYTDIYDFYINNYFNIFDDNLMGFEETNPYCEQFDENNITKENAYTGVKSTTELIESSSNMSSIDQNKSQNLQMCHIDRIQDCGSYPTDFITYPTGTAGIENVRVFNDMNISNYLNSENFSMKGNEVISQDKTLIQTVNSTDVSVSNSKCPISENKKDLCVIQCSQCRKLFNNKHQLWKHLTCCDFYKEDFKCHICDKIYRHKSSLAQHLRNTHNVSHGLHDKFYICNKCSKSYVRFRAFQRHMLLHDD